MLKLFDLSAQPFRRSVNLVIIVHFIYLIISLAESETVHETTWPSKDPTEKPMYIPAGTKYVAYFPTTLLYDEHYSVPPTAYL
jgi:hypothetical protein